MLTDETTAHSSLTQTYEYNAAGQIVKASPKYIQAYAYDAGNRLLKHTRADAAGKRDSVPFTYSGETTIGTCIFPVAAIPATRRNTAMPVTCSCLRATPGTN